MATLSEAVRQRVYERARHRCEYCLTSRRVIGMPLVIDHILPIVLGGDNDPENLCAACYRCNEFKGRAGHNIRFVPTNGAGANSALISAVAGDTKHKIGATQICTHHDGLPLVRL